MNPEYIAASIVHTIPEKLSEYFLEPFTNLLVVFGLIIMFANVYMLKKLWKIKARDYMLVINIVTIGIYCIFGIISAILVSRLGPHGTLTIDNCDSVYMSIPRTILIMVFIVNTICCIISIVTKLKKDREYDETIKRGYFAEAEETRAAKHDDISAFIDNIKEKIDINKIKDKVSEFTEDVKDMINNKKS